MSGVPPHIPPRADRTYHITLTVRRRWLIGPRGWLWEIRPIGWDVRVDKGWALLKAQATEDAEQAARDHRAEEAMRMSPEHNYTYTIE